MKIINIATAIAAAICTVGFGSVANAGTFTYHFDFVAPNTGTYANVVVAGDFTTDGKLTTGGPPVDIIGITGSVSGGAAPVVDGPISGLSPYAAADNKLYAAGIDTGNYYSFGGVSFTVTKGGRTADYNLFGNYNNTVNLLVSTVDPIGYPQNGAPAAPVVNGAITNSVTAVPEPATWAMLILGLGGIGAVLRRRHEAGFVAA